MQAWPALTTANATLPGTMSAAALVVCGLALTAGIFTRASSSLVGLGYALAPFESFDWALLPRHDGAATLVGVAAAAALGLLGPGAFSFDARRFGRREIFIAARRVSEESESRTRLRFRDDPGEKDIPYRGDSCEER